MKQILCLVLSFSFFGTWSVRSQDAATEERLNKLSGQIEDLIASQKEQKQRISALAKEFEAMREHLSKPTANYAEQEDLKRLADSIREVDRKRLDDIEKIHSELLKIGQSLSTPTTTRKKSGLSTPMQPSENDKSDKPEKIASAEKGFKYTIQQHDTLSVIVQAYRDKNIKISTDQILKANPGLNPNKLRVGQEIFIPAPQQKGEG